MGNKVEASDEDGVPAEDDPRSEPHKSRHAPLAAATFSALIGIALVGFLFIVFVSPVGFGFDASVGQTAVTAVGALLVAAGGFVQVQAHVLKEAGTGREGKPGELALAMIFLGGLMLAFEPASKVLTEILASA